MSIITYDLKYLILRCFDQITHHHNQNNRVRNIDLKLLELKKIFRFFF